MKGIFASVCLLLAYGSLYPFGFTFSALDKLGSDFHGLLSLAATSRGDIVGNFVLFVPFGVSGALAFVAPRWRTGAVIGLLAGGAAFAAVLQAMQLLVPSRAPSLFDVVMNLVGIVAGLALARNPYVAGLGRGDGSLPRFTVALIVASCWPLSMLLPLVPTLDLANVHAAVKPLLNERSLSVVETLNYLIGWVAAVFLIVRAPIPGRYVVWVSLVPAVVIAAQPLILGARLTPPEVLGGFLAVVVWWLFGRRIDPVVLGVTLLLVTIAGNLLPLPVVRTATSFSFVPFSGFLNGDMLTNSKALLEKVFTFGAVILLFRKGWVGTVPTLAVLVGGLMVQEMLQAYIGTGTPEITDPILAAGVAAFIASTLRSSGRVSAGAAHLPASEPGGERSGSRQGIAVAALSTGVGYLPGLHGLRAVAALAVFLVHFQQTVNLQFNLGEFDLDRWLTNGNTGVALFFVLSGFLLALPLFNAHAAGGGKFQFWSYLARRMARILPAYYLCLFSLVGIAMLRENPPSINNTLSHLVFLYNVNEGQILSINAPFWTLAVEVQFYLLLPFIVLGLRMLPGPVAAVVAFALIPGAYWLNEAMMALLLERERWPIRFMLIWPFSVLIEGPKSPVLTYSTLAHLTFFFFGVAAATIVPYVTRRASSAGRVAWVYAEAAFWLSGLAVFLILATPLDDWAQVPFGRYNWPLVPLLLTLIVVSVYHTRGAQRVLEWTPLRALGVISYGVYLFHLPIQRAGEILLERLGLSVVDYWLLFGCGTLAATVFVATASFLLLERPILRWVRAGGGSMQGTASPPAPVSSSLIGRAGLAAVSRGRHAPAAGPDALRPRGNRTSAARSGKGGAANRPNRRWWRVGSRDQGDEALRRERAWVQRRIRLSEQHWTGIQEIAEAQGCSVSRALRMMLDEWLDTDSAHAEGVLAGMSGEIGKPYDRQHDCKVNLRRSRAIAIDQRTRGCGADCDELVASLISSRLARDRRL